MNLSINSVSNKPCFGANVEFSPTSGSAAKEFIVKGYEVLTEQSIPEVTQLHERLKEMAPGMSITFNEPSSISYAMCVNDFKIPLLDVNVPRTIIRGGARNPHYDIKNLYLFMIEQTQKAEKEMKSLPPGLKLLGHDIYSKSK